MYLFNKFPAYIKELPTHLNIDGMKIVMVKIYQIPSLVSKSWFNFFIFSNNPFVLSMKIRPIITSKYIQNLDLKKNSLRSTINNFNSAYYSKIIGDIETTKQSLISGDEKVFGFDLIYETTPKVYHRMKSELYSKSIFSSIDYLSQIKSFLQLLGIAEIKKKRIYDLTTLSYLLSFKLRHNKSGSIYSINKTDNSLIILNRFLLNNHNGIIFGTSGSGKSYSAKLEIIKMYMEGVDVWVIDPENEYESLTNHLQGEYINVSIDSTTPMGIIAGLSKQESVSICYTFICALLRIEGSSLLEIIIEKHITDDDFRLESIYLSLNETEEGQSLKEKLHRFVYGSLKNAFSFKTSLFTKQVTVFNIQQIPLELRDIYMLILATSLWTKIINNKNPFMLFIDESWMLLRNPYMGEFINSLTKRIRKYNGGITFITQDINDFLQTNYGRTILSNCSYKLILKQEISSISLLTKVLHLSTSETKYLYTISRGEGLMSLEDWRFPCNLFVTSYESQLLG